jgi:hypothetical protein
LSLETVAGVPYIRRVRRVAVVLVVVAAVSCGAAVAARAGGPSGDPATITFYHQVQDAYRSVGAIAGTRTGFLSYKVSPGLAFSYRFGQSAPAGYRPARESLLFLFRNGRDVKFVDRASAKGLPPLTIIQDARGAWANVSRRPGACFYRSPGASSLGGVGHPFVGVFGNFSPLKRSGGTVIVRSSYPWGKTGAAASEVDRISASTKLLLSEQVHVAGAAPFSFSLGGLREKPIPSFVPAPVPQC